ncbi:unnamed protein product [Urochloa decumbens]|uniref:Uncharacterized protein n=1 Tax=Urochloa decumbens TaxID=240449 RepID=A0ABC9ENN8_9POAL
MDGDCGVICHLQCEIISVSVTGLGCGGGAGGELFLRCHVPAGGGRSIQIDSRGAYQPDGGETTTPPGTAAAVSWRDVASLSCDGSPARVRELVDRGAVVFEVRRRRAALLGRVLMGSELVGRAVVPWRSDAGGGSGDDVAVAVELAAPSSRRRVLGEEAPAAILSAKMSVRVSDTWVPAGRRRAGVGSVAAQHPHRYSGCEWSAGDEDVFAAVAFAADDAFE